MVVCEGGFMASTIASLMMNGVCCVWQMQEEEDRRDAIRKDIRVEYERQRVIEQELWEQRRREQLLQQQQGVTAENWYNNDTSSVHTDHRRRKLIADKMSLSSNSNNNDTTYSLHQQQQHHDHDGVFNFHNVSTKQAVASATKSGSPLRQQQQQQQSAVVQLVQTLASPLSRQPIKKRKVRTLPSPPKRSTQQQQQQQRLTKSPQSVADMPALSNSSTSLSSPNHKSNSHSCGMGWNGMSSLMDAAFDADEDDEDVMITDENDYGIEEVTSLVDVSLH